MRARYAAVTFAMITALNVCAADLGVNSFSRLGPLADPGYTPDHLGYPVDRIAERLDLLFTRRGEETLTLCLAFADEKLAEANIMVRASEAGYAWIAVGLYKDYIKRAARAIDAVPASALAASRLRYANALLEHLYRLSLNYLTMPIDVREFSFTPLVNSRRRHGMGYFLGKKKSAARLN
jgi:hypothetical protein